MAVSRFMAGTGALVYPLAQIPDRQFGINHRS